MIAMSRVGFYFLKLAVEVKGLALVAGFSLAGTEGAEPFILTVSIYNISIGSSYVDKLIIPYNLRKSRVFT